MDKIEERIIQYTKVVILLALAVYIVASVEEIKTLLSCA